MEMYQIWLEIGFFAIMFLLVLIVTYVLNLKRYKKKSFYWYQNAIKQNGYDYEVNIKIGNFDFPTKTYGDISLPAGEYDALRIEIG